MKEEGIIGRNGAGKSTLLKILSRITEPTTGRVRLRGRVASLLEVGTGFHPELTGRENIFLNGAILGMSRIEITRKFDEIVEFAESAKFLDTPVKRYSSGMYVRLAFAVAAHLEPEILVVDEVLAVGDAAFRRKCIGKMNTISKQEGKTILFVSHHIETLQNLCNAGIYLRQGTLAKKSSIEDVCKQYLADMLETGIKRLKDRTDRRGSGLIRFSEASFKNSRDELVSSFFSGDEAVLCLKYENFEQKDLKSFHCSIGIDDETGRRIIFLSTDLTNDFPEKTDAFSNEIQVRINKIPLMPGKYRFTVFATINGEIADWVQNAGYFNVEPGDFYNTGRLSPPGQGIFLVEHSFLVI